ncbi:hypothetical protein [Caballeronia sp. ATUFL_M2_KS44]|nr:hypothetical protein [Caballeronia sp. ATUFL_M2_KS44]
MFEIDTALEQFSLLDDFSSYTPVWRPFVEHAQNDAHEYAGNEHREGL